MYTFWDCLVVKDYCDDMDSSMSYVEQSLNVPVVPNSLGLSPQRDLYLDTILVLSPES
jgi:hypothetical protein